MKKFITSGMFVFLSLSASLIAENVNNNEMQKYLNIRLNSTQQMHKYYQYDSDRSTSHAYICGYYYGQWQAFKEINDYLIVDSLSINSNQEP